MSAYQASSKTLTFCVVAIVFFVSAAVGQAQTPQSLGRFLCADGNQACMCSADPCPVRVCGCLCRSGKRVVCQDSQWSTGTFTAADRQKTPVCATRFCFLRTSQHSIVSTLVSA
jgi:hypothetical protein